MDSMRHLSTSLPPQRNEPSDILSDFRAAALSVTNLYKNAAKAQDRSRATGYQDALDDLLAFLDKEKLGLGDNEGWRVRRWATERLDGDGRTPRQGATADTMVDDDDDNNSTSKDEDKDDERGSSPESTKKPQSLAISTSDLAEEDSVAHRRVVSEPPQQPPTQQHELMQTDFTFQSIHPYPTNHDRGGNGAMELDGSTTAQYQASSLVPSTPSSTETLRVVRPRRSNKHGGRRTDNRAPTMNFNLGSGAGSKRKIPYTDFFDISSLNESGDRKDNNGNGRGGKRGRHV